SRRLATAGIQRLEFQGTTTRDEFEAFLIDVLARVSLSIMDTAETRMLQNTGIRFGAVGIRGTESEASKAVVPAEELSFNLEDEAKAMRWLHREVTDRATLPIAEAEAVVRSLAV